MKRNKRSSVLVCVTGQFDCDRLIRVGHEIAVQNNYDLKVLCVLKPVSDYSILGQEFEYLHRTAANLGSDMMILFNEDAPTAAADYAKQIRAKQLVTGMYDGKPDGFVFKLNELAPNLQMSMVTKENSVHKIEPVHV